MTHSFKESLERGMTFEADLDAYFGRSYEVHPVDMDGQWGGKDRVLVSRQTGMVYTIEYTGDDKAADTGNVFIETVSSDRSGRKGWALTSQAQLIAVYVPRWRRVYVVAAVDLKAAVKGWQARCGLKKADNDGYATWGVCVPVGEFEKVVRRRHDMPPKDAA